MQTQNYKILYSHEVLQNFLSNNQPFRVLDKNVASEERLKLQSNPFEQISFDQNVNFSNDAYDENHYLILQPKSYLLHDVITRTQYGVLTLDNNVVRESIFHFPWHKFQNFKKHGERYKEDACEFLSGEAEIDLDAAFTACSGFNENYYHWMVLFLGQINSLFLDSWKEEVRSSFPIILPKYMSDVQKDSALTLAEYYNLPILWLSKPVSIRIRQLILPLPMRSGGLKPHPVISNSFKIIRNKFYRIGDYPKKIYISRSDSRNRMLVNEHELEDALAKRGYEIVRLLGMSLSDQVNIFAHAHSIISPHGAGLTNLGFSDSGTKVLEIHMPTYLNWCFRRMSSIFGINYNFLTGRMVQDNSQKIHTSTYEIDLNKVQNCFEAGF